MISYPNQNKQIIIAVVKGIHKILKEKECKTLPLNKASVALPIPQPGQGIPVIDLNKQKVWGWFEKVSDKNNAAYPPAIKKIASRHLA
jgi:hypothetical protein